ncbi:MAG: TPM domain-containing protein, partial [Sulfuriferula sp.]
MKHWLATLIALLCLYSASAVLAEVPVPALKARVTDLTNTLTAAQAASLEQQLSDLEKRKGSQLAVLIVPTTAPEAIEQYSIRVAEAWKLGRKGVDDGVLMLVAKNDRTLRIEVGYGLEGVIPDAIAKRVIAETIVP